MTQNLGDVAEVVLRGKLVAMQSYSRNKQNLKINNLPSHLKQLEKKITTKTQSL